jgi:hypothetical protein
MSYESALRRKARGVIQSEMRAYDRMVVPSRIRVVPPTKPIDASPTSETHCAHGVLLFEPCTKCERNLADCEAYRRAAMSRIRELLSKIGGRS